MHIYSCTTTVDRFDRCGVWVQYATLTVSKYMQYILLLKSYCGVWVQHATRIASKHMQYIPLLKSYCGVWVHTQLVLLANTCSVYPC